MILTQTTLHHVDLFKKAKHIKTKVLLICYFYIYTHHLFMKCSAIIDIKCELLKHHGHYNLYPPYLPLNITVSKFQHKW